jgi:hypothetical protein
MNSRTMRKAGQFGKGRVGGAAFLEGEWPSNAARARRRHVYKARHLSESKFFASSDVSGPYDMC